LTRPRPSVADSTLSWIFDTGRRCPQKCVRGDLLAQLNRADEAQSEFQRAASLTRNTRERELLLKRAAALR